MKSYQKPIVLKSDELCEGIYLDSGDSVRGSSCESKYMKGNFQKPKDWYLDTDTMISRGCEGCPAAYSYSECRRDEKNFGDPLMPKWELLGKDPDSNYKC